MKAAIVKSDSNIEIKNMIKPSLGPDDMLVKMHACGICGSDVEKVFGEYGQASMKLGHEPAGTITEIGSEILDFSVGDRVFTHHHVACYSDNCHECNHGNETMCKKYYESNLEPCGLADEYVVPGWNVKHGGVLKIPDNMSFEEAAMIEPLACCIRSWNKFTHKTNDSVAILGVGPTGIMHVLLANDYRLDFAQKLETITIRSDDPTASEIIKSNLQHPFGVDVVIVATGNLKALQDAVTFVRKGGTIVMFGVPSKGATVELDMSKVYSKSITIVNSYAASDMDTRDALEKISSKQINVTQLITHKYKLDECQKAFEHAKSGENAMKIIISE